MMKSILLFGEVYLSQNYDQQAHKYFKRAADIANSLEGSVEPDLLNVRARVYIKYARSSLRFEMVDEAFIYLNRATELLLSCLSIRSNKTVQSKTPPLKCQKRLNQAIKMLAILFINWHKYYQKCGMLPKSIESLKVACFVC